MKVHKDNIKFIEEVGFQKGKLEERERILKLIDKEIEFWKAKPNEVVNIVFGLECLKEQLQKEIGEEKGK